MSFLIICPQRDPSPWIRALKDQDPDIEIEVFPEVKDPYQVEFALSWRHPHGIFGSYPNLQVIASMGAGIDHIVEDPSIPPHIRITRIVDQQLSRDMSVFVLSLVLEEVRNLSYHHCTSVWNPRSYRRPEDVRVGIMGMGELGQAVAQQLNINEFKVHGWRKRKIEHGSFVTYFGRKQLDAFLERTDVLVCLLPLTAETKDILNKELFGKLPRGAYIINVARGKHLVEEDLLEMINSGHLSGASLDVFREEPLPDTHAFRRHDRIRITPHIASVTRPETVVPQLLENYRNMEKKDLLKNLVSRENEY